MLSNNSNVAVQCLDENPATYFRRTENTVLVTGRAKLV